MADDAAAPAGQLSTTDEAEPAKPTDEGDAPTTGADEPAEASDDEDAAADSEDVAAPVTKPPMSHVRLALIAGLVTVLALSGLIGWLGYRAYEASALQEQRNLFLQVGRQGALNLTTIDFEHVDDDVKRIIDSATGPFYDQFQQRAQPFIEVVKQVKSKSVGNVTEAGLESESGDEAKVLVAVTVNTAVAGQPEQAPRAWRMRISVQKVGDEAKVSNVEFVQ
jgi:Mce-associated membrane protein